MAAASKAALRREKQWKPHDSGGSPVISRAIQPLSTEKTQKYENPP